MSSTSIIMMVAAVGFYSMGFVYFINKAFNAKQNK